MVIWVASGTLDGELPSFFNGYQVDYFGPKRTELSLHILCHLLSPSGDDIIYGFYLFD